MATDSPVELCFRRERPPKGGVALIPRIGVGLSAVHRTRPVVLTATATVLAMIPLTLRAFWGPMAIAIIGGLTVATLLTIFFLPALRCTRRGSGSNGRLRRIRPPQRPSPQHERVGLQSAEQPPAGHRDVTYLGRVCRSQLCPGSATR